MPLESIREVWVGGTVMPPPDSEVEGAAIVDSWSCCSSSSDESASSPQRVAPSGDIMLRFSSTYCFVSEQRCGAFDSSLLYGTALVMVHIICVVLWSSSWSVQL